MALIKCPECGKEISDRATSCPNCGFPITADNSQAPKEYRFEVDFLTRIEANKHSIKAFYNNKLVLDVPASEFTLIYNKEERSDSGRPQLKVAFFCPQYKDAFMICENITSQKYTIIKQFVESIAEKYFKKDYVDSWYSITEYVKDHYDQSKIDEMNTRLQSTEMPKMCNDVKPEKPVQQQPETVQIYKAPDIQSNSCVPQQKQKVLPEEKDEPFWASEAFSIVMLLLIWPVGLFTMWKYKHFKKGTRIAWSIIIPVLVFSVFLGEVYQNANSAARKQRAFQQEVQDLVDEMTESVGSSTDSSETANPDVITVGSTFKADGLQITLDDANTDFQDYDDKYGYNTPDDGMKYVKATFTYENVGNSDEYASIYDFKCYADNQTCEQVYSLGDDDFINTNLSSGRNVSFSTYYTVPVNSQSIELEYAALWTSERILIKLQ